MALSYSAACPVPGSARGLKMGRMCLYSISISSFIAPIPFHRFAGRVHKSKASIGIQVLSSAQLPKTFDFSAEERIYNWWESQGFFKPNLNKDGRSFVISMPPPNVTGALHMGHAMFVTLEDIMIRYWRMKGRSTLWIPGTDHAGIATQLVVEKLLASEGTRREDLSRDEFVARVWEWKRKYGGTITNQLRRLGASCDWSREHFTLDDQLSQAVVEAFIQLHEKGLVYRGTYMVNWSPNLQTAVSDLEVEYSDEPGTLFYFKYPVAGGSIDDFLPVATTRPETLFGDTAVAVHPQDDRYKKYIGKMAIVPMSGGRVIPIVADNYVDREFGTGALKITPGHDQNDYVIGEKLGLPLINIMNKDGTLNENAGPYRGLDRFVARSRLWLDLETAGLALRAEPYTLRVPRSQRGGEVIEPLVSKQWFVIMKPLAKKALEALENGDLKIIPERFEKTYNQWLSNIKDWCISRQLWWGHRIPVWHVKEREGEYIVARNEAEAYKKAFEKYSETVHLEQDSDVLDTWFSSGLWPFSTLGWPNKRSEDFVRFYPTTVLETGHDILFFWVARMVMMGIEFTGRPPFSYVYLHGLVRDSQFDKEGSVLDLCLSERWVVTKLHELIDLVTSSYERFSYGEAGRAIYEFFWSEFADWYIEASKTRFFGKEDASTISCAQAVLLYVFENVLKLLHPFMPYVTEELWQALPARNSALIVANWPKMLLPRDVKAVENFESLQTLIRSIRNARAEYSVEPAKRISATIVGAPEILGYICNEKTVIATLSRLDIENLHFTHTPPEHAKLAVHLIAREGLEAYLPVTDMVDISTEIERVSKRLVKLQSEYDGHMKRLTSANFVEKAPAIVVQQVHDKANEAQEKIAILNNRLAFLQSTILSSK
ncbi:valine--tRNA ligase, chloroplastic/mitochondrial 2 isoform X2 [Cryptomeria japonica]|uniref:valine--tRNA ligase, chloroplastic/mitochondrial 2 isoform X2 n=1 Tax=Cryptomeria japonica TaxID=3369 RepID=UPI0025ACFAC0|nr:valine--tRNA ligase, chloroplastic/mitochondrial 2 isoform X2 [Cryptomeria japonica]